MLSFHKYWNFNTTDAIQHILDTRNNYNVPVWLGETGENSNVWFTEAVRLLETNNIGWAWWPLKKLGNNNPMQVKSNKEYEKVLAFWSGNGPKPSAAEACKGLMELAAATRLENTNIKRDVLDALFRQPFSQATIPFKANVIRSGSVVKAVDYDLGRNGAAYFDTDSADYHISNGKRGGNRGRVYRNDGVDIAVDPSMADSYFVTHTESGEWLQYTIDVVKAGRYRIKLNYNLEKENAKLSLQINNSETKKLTVPKATGWQSLEIDITLKEGSNNIRIYVDSGGMSLRDMQFTAVE